MAHADKPVFEKIPEQYISLEQFDFAWTKQDIQVFRQMWKEGKSIATIADKLRPTDKGTVETLLLMFDQVQQGAIKPREKLFKL
jgi:hypothetical protein